MTALSELLGAAAVQSLGWALLHFLWQGTLVSLVLVALLWLLRASGPSWRYLVSCLALALMLPLPLITYAVLTPRAQTMPELAYDLAPASQPWQSAETGEAGAVGTHQTDEPARSRLEPFLPYLVTFWLTGVLVFSIRLLGGLWLLRKLKRRFHRSVSEELRLKCSQLARRLGITRAVGLRESLAVRVPLVIGWLRPMILLPTSVISGLSVTQLEMILAHELAHIRRNDYLVNLLQNLAETLLFYHPAVWWVSAKIREEREHCCDDMAVRACNGDRYTYAKALAKLDDLRLERLAPAATGGSLVGRIRRLAGKTLPQTPDPMQWTVGLVLILVPILTWASANQPLLPGSYMTQPFSVEELTAQGYSAEVACENSGRWLMVLTDEGFFSGNQPEDEACTYEKPYVTGSWRLADNQITFQDSEDLGCGLEEYSYSYRLRDEALTLSPIKDSCPLRAYLFTSHPWQKQE